MRHRELGITSDGRTDAAFANGTAEIPTRGGRVVSPNVVAEYIRTPRTISVAVFPHAQKEDEAVKKVSVSDRETDSPPGTTMSMRIGEENITRDFATLGWRSQSLDCINMITTHPDVIARMADDGPLAFEPYVSVGEDLTIDTIHLQNAPVVSLLSPHGAYRIRLDASQGLIHMHDDVPVHAIVAEGALAPRRLYDKPAEVFNLPNSIVSKDGFIYQTIPLAGQVPDLLTAFAHLGFAWDKERGYKTLPVPSEYVRRMRTLRETDTSSGIYYPDVELLSTGDIAPHIYLASYAQGRYPFAAKTFMHYDHDVSSQHGAAYMVHGEMAMDVSMQYSQAILDSDIALFTYAPQLQGVMFEGEMKEEKAAYVNDIFTTDLGLMDLHGNGRGIGMYTLVYNDIVNTLKLDDRLGELKIVDWMQEHGMVRDYTDMSGEDLLQGILAHSRERFLQLQS